jgi:SAM-dependent methyltransferase
MSLALTKTLDPADFDLLPKELAIVDQSFTSASPQHPMRRWEYALALDAIWRWRTQTVRTQPSVVDVGGGGSPFRFMVGPSDGWRTPAVIDPEESMDLATYIGSHPRLADCVTCLSVLEHVDDLDQFLYHLSCLVAPGGLLFLTVDCCDDPIEGAPSDRYHFHWMRKRIFNRWSMGALVEDRLARWGFTLFGEADLTYHGPHVYDYTFASLALQKRA